MKSGDLIQLGEDVTVEARYDHGIVIPGRAKRQNTSIIAPQHLHTSKIPLSTLYVDLVPWNPTFFFPGLPATLGLVSCSLPIIATTIDLTFNMATRLLQRFPESTHNGSQSLRSFISTRS